MQYPHQVLHFQVINLLLMSITMLPTLKLFLGKLQWVLEMLTWGNKWPASMFCPYPNHISWQWKGQLALCLKRRLLKEF